MPCRYAASTVPHAPTWAMAIGLTVSFITKKRRRLERIKFSPSIVKCTVLVHCDKDQQQNMGKQSHMYVYPVTNWQACRSVTKNSTIKGRRERCLVEEARPT